MEDLEVFKMQAGSRLAETPAPAERLEAWLDLARDFPVAWKAIVTQYDCIADDTGVVSESAKAASGKKKTRELRRRSRCLRV